MRNCPTGYCGDPCLCKGALDHLSRNDAKDMLRLADNRIKAIDAKAASEKHGESLVPYAAIEVVLCALKYNGSIVKCNELLHRVVLAKPTDRIETVSGIKSVLLDTEGNPIFRAGHVPETNTRIRFEVLQWGDTVGVSVDCEGGYIQEAYTKLNYTTVFLPEGY